MRKAIGIFLATAVIALVAAPKARAGDEYYKGCLVGTHDNYVLRTDDGQLYRLHDKGDEDFREHLGDIVSIKGEVSDHGRERQAQEQTPNQNAAGVEIPRHALHVKSIKTISHGCAEVKNGEAIIVPVPVPVTTQQSTTTVAGGAQTTTTTTTTGGGAALPQSPVVIDRDKDGDSMQHFVGCLVGTDDFFVLRATDGGLYRLRSMSSLREHVGETVDVAGRIDNSRREIDAQRQAELAQQIGVNIPQVGVNVANIRTISKGCSTEPK